MSPRSPKKYRRSPYERPIQLADDDTRPRSSRYSYDLHRSQYSPAGSDVSSPPPREPMSIETLLSASAQGALSDEVERGVSSERSTSRRLSQ
jgi:hypothetical protein